MKINYAALGGFLGLALLMSTAYAANPTDPQIDAGKLALTKTKSPDVKKFAQLMITDHTGVNKSAVALVTKLHVTPEPDPISQSLQKGGDENLATLKKLSGSAFDKAYIEHAQVEEALLKSALSSAAAPFAPRFRV